MRPERPGERSEQEREMERPARGPSGPVSAANKSGRWSAANKSGRWSGPPAAALMTWLARGRPETGLLRVVGEPLARRRRGDRG